MSKEELLKLLLEGKSHKEIAETLHIGKSTVGYWIKKYDLNEYNVHKPPKPAYNFNKIDTPEKAHTLGFILADGNINIKLSTLGLINKFNSKNASVFGNTIVDIISVFKYSCLIQPQDRHIPLLKAWLVVIL